MMKRIWKSITALLLLASLALGGCGHPVSSDSSGSSISALESSSETSSSGEEENPPKTAEEVISELLADENLGTSYEEKYETPRYAEEWTAVQEKKKSLTEGGNYTEGFEGDYISSRLYPEVTVNGASVAFMDAEKDMGSGKNLKIFTDGDENGNYDAVVFRGMGIVPGARYRLTLTAKTLTDGRNYYVGFRSGAQDLYAFNFSGMEGQVQTVSGVVTLQNAEYDGVVLMIAGGGPAELLIDNLKIERIASLSLVDLTKIGDVLTLDFEENADYVAANNSSIERTSKNALSGTSLLVRKTGAWQGLDFTDMKFLSSGTYRVSFQIRLVSGEAGMAFATMSSAANGSYQDVGKAISVASETTLVSETYTLKEYSDYYFNLSVSSADCVFMVDDVKIECIRPEDIVEPGTPVDLTTVGAKYEQSFDEETPETLLSYFKPNASATVLVENADGKALQISKTGNWSGLDFNNFVFAPKGTYLLSFDICMTKKHAWDTDNFFVTMGDNTEYKKAENIGALLTEGKTAHISLTFPLEDYGEYSLSFSNYGGDSVYWIDDFRIERIA